MPTNAETDTVSVSTIQPDASIRNKNDDGLGPAWKFWRRKRHIIVVLMFFGFFNSLSVRTNLMVAINAMVKSRENPEGEFNWNMTIVGFVLGSFFYGQLVLTFVGGYVSTRLGHVHVFGFAIGFPAFISIFTQYFARLHFGALICLRTMEGLVQSMAFPSSLGIWTLWVPPLECSRLTAFAYAGAYVGIIFTMGISGFISHHLGWPSIFTCFGGLGILWYATWLTVVRESPKQDPKLHPKELEFLQVRCIVRVKAVQHPWAKIFTSPPVLSLLACHFAIAWAHYTYSQMPMFFQDTLEIDIAISGLLSAAPYIVLVISLQLAGNLIYFILKRELMSLGRVRRLFLCLGFALQGLFFLSLGFSNTLIVNVTLLVAAAASEGISEPNFIVNTLEIAPLHATVLLGISNTVATMAGIVSATVTGYIVPDKTKEQWTTVLIIAACVSFGASIIYFMFGCAMVQPWAVQVQSDEKPKRKTDMVGKSRSRK